MSLPTGLTYREVSLDDMRKMLLWEAKRDNDKKPELSDDFMMRWLDTNSASVRDIQKRIDHWKNGTTDYPEVGIDSEGNKIRI